MRISKGMSSTALAKLAKIGISTLSELESGNSKRPRGDTLISIANALEISYEWIITGSGSPVMPHQPSMDEQELLQIYETLSPAAKGRLLGYARGLLDQETSVPSIANPFPKK